MKLIQHRVLLLFIYIALLSPVLTWSAEQSQRSQKLQRHIANLSQDATEIVWVFFRDKGMQNISETRNSLEQVRQNMPRRTLQRRAKVRSQENLVGYRDLPVYSQYVRAIVSLPGVERHRVTTRWLNGISVEATASAINKISSLPFVRNIRYVARGRRIEPSPIEDAQMPESSLARREAATLDYGYSYNQLQQINATAAHQNGYTGQGVRVLVLDTGYMTDHEVFTQGRVIAQYDFINDDPVTQNEPGDLSSQHNHGTQSASVMGAAVDGSLYGPAYECQFLLAKTEDLSQEQPIEEDWYVAGLEWGEQNGADVSTSSLAYRDWYTSSDYDGDTPVTSQAVDIAVANGMVCVTAAGNYGDSGLGAPADADSVITCGAVNGNGAIASFSSRGPTADGRIKPEVLARGVSTWMARTNTTSSYGTGNGTSFSTPLVAGAAAQVIQAHPDWPPMLVKEALMMTADNAGDPNNTYGWGIIDVMAAIDFAMVSDLRLQFVEGASGNENGVLEPGETGALTGVIKNSRLITAESVTISVAAESPGTDLQDGSLTWTNLGSTEESPSITTIPVTLDSTMSHSGGALFRVIIEAEYQDYVYHDTVTVAVPVGDPRVAVVDMTPTQSGEASLVRDLASLEIGANVLHTFPQEGFNAYEALFLSLGSGDDASVLNEAQSQSIFDYLNQGGNVYLEGGPVWYRQSASDIQSHFHVAATDSFVTGYALNGGSDTPLAGMTFAIDSVAGSTGQFVNLLPMDNAEGWAAIQGYDVPALVVQADSDYVAIASSVGYEHIKAESGDNTRIDLLQALVHRMKIWKRGDVTGDGEIDIRDLLLLLTDEVSNAAVLSPRLTYTGDVNMDGAVTHADVTELSEMILVTD